MRLADFIDTNMQTILREWEQFAATLLPADAGITSTSLRNHAPQMLRAISQDLRTAQSRSEQIAKSWGQAPVDAEAGGTAAHTHALLRAAEGFTITQLVAEYRALRASVLRLWSDAAPYRPETLVDIGQFNEAIDRALAESVDYFTREVDRWRSLFLGVLGHDLRSPLNAVLLTSQVVSAESQGRRINHYAKSLIDSGERMKKLLDDLLDFNRSTLEVGIRISPALVDLEPVCREEILLLSAAIPEANIELESSGALWGNWDASRIRQGISNLVNNAAKYGALQSPIRVSLHRVDEKIRLAVENRGPSIPPEQLESLFDPLRRYAHAPAPHEKTSLGLGLFIVRQVALAHGGNVTVSCDDGTTSFAMVFPRNGAPQSGNNPIQYSGE